MAENLFKSFAVFGAGAFGTPLTHELVNNGASVVVFTRPSTKHRNLPAKATHVPIDLTDVAALTEQLRLHKVEVAISAINHEHLDVQDHTLEATKNAGVKMYIPSEYGLPTEGQDGLLGQKSAFVDRIKENDIPFLRLYVGLFIDFIPFILGIDWNGEITLLGEGNKPTSWTSLADATGKFFPDGYLAYVVTHLPLQDLKNRTLRIEGQRCTFRQIADQYGDTVKVVQASQFPNEIDSPRMREYLQAEVEAGEGTSTYDPKTKKDEHKLDNDLWPDHRWLTVRQTLGL